MGKDGSRIFGVAAIVLPTQLYIQRKRGGGVPTSAGTAHDLAKFYENEDNLTERENAS